MALFPEFSVENTPQSSEQALRVPVGVASPLWFAYAGAASAGVAYWLMTRWAKPANLEAFTGWFDKSIPDGTILPQPVVAATLAFDRQAETIAKETQAVAAEVAEVTAETAEDLTSATVEAVETAADVAEAVSETVLEAAEPVLEEAQDAAQTAVAAVTAAADDLTRIVGIGPKLAARLADLGVKSFSDMAGWTAEDVDRFDKEMDLKGRAVRDAWVVQARRLAKA